MPPVTSCEDVAHSGLRSKPIQRVIIYTDIEDSALQAHILEAARRVSPMVHTDHSRVVLITEASLRQGRSKAASPQSAPAACADTSTAPSLAFIREWERVQADFKAAVDDELVWMERLECLVTAKYTLRSAPVAYALHCLQMPVLSLHSVSTTGAVESSSSAPPRLPLEDVLYYDTVRLEGPAAASGDGEEHTATTAAAARQAACVSAFFQSLSHSESGHVRAVELAAVDAHGQVPDVTPAHLDIYAAHINRTQPTGTVPDKLMFVDEAGFPAWTACAKAGVAPRLAPVAPTYQALLDALMEKDGAFADVLAYNPQLVGALRAFNRYQNRGLVRTLVQQGFTVVYVNFLSTTAQKLAEAEAQNAGRLVADLSTVLLFESHWLELPLPTDGLVMSPDLSAVASASASAVPAWLAAIWASSDTDGQQRLFDLLPWLHKDHVLGL